MSQSTQFAIKVSLEKFDAYVSGATGLPTVIDLSTITDCVTIPDDGSFDITTDNTSVEIAVNMDLTNEPSGITGEPLFYFPNVGSFSYRSGYWFVTSLSLSGEGNTPNQESVFGEDIVMTLDLMSGMNPAESVEFRIHFMISYWKNNVLNNYPVYIDPKLKVSHPPSTPPPTA